MNEERQVEVYKQDWENMRYQDRLRWSRFQTIFAIEGAFLYGAYRSDLSHFESFIVSIVGTLLVLIVSLLARKDDSDARIHLDRAADFEDKWGVGKLKPETVLKGKHLMYAALVLLNVFNVTFVVYRASFLCN